MVFTRSPDMRRPHRLGIRAGKRSSTIHNVVVGRRGASGLPIGHPTDEVFGTLRQLRAGNRSFRSCIFVLKTGRVRRVRFRIGAQ